MANTNGMTFAEGHSSNRSPLFNGNHYTYWKNRMRIFIQALDYEAWKIIRDGPYFPTKIVNETKVSKSEEEWDERDSRLIQLNAKAINMLYGVCFRCKRVQPNFCLRIRKRNVG
jgi:hypothetical protein